MFKLTNYIAINVSEIEKATHFYKTVLGFSFKKGNNCESRLEKDNITLFLDKDSNNPGMVFFEFETIDMNQAISVLKENGCTIRKKVSEKSMLICDPFGVNFHLYERGAELDTL